MTLESHQETLLSKLIEAQTSVPVDERTPFEFLSQDQKSFIRHPSFPDRHMDVLDSDMELLKMNGLILFTDKIHFAVTPSGLGYFGSKK
ncbi:MAG: hypothetical protein E3J72_11200 [Planctomycetota bacterium]|nr:MAG: hypothetical protein E3J72_11200 [Planctomycetota bacterium]